MVAEPANVLVIYPAAKLDSLFADLRAAVAEVPR